MLLASVPSFARWADVANTRVATLDVVSGVRGEEIGVATLTEMLQVALVDRRAFAVVELLQIGKAMREQEFQAGGLSDAQAARAGVLAGADKVLASSISKMGDAYSFIAKAVATTTGIVEVSDQVQSPTVAGFIELFPVMADRTARKVRGEGIAACRPPAPGEVVAAPPPRSAIPWDGLLGE